MKIIYTNPDGSLCVVNAVDKDVIEQEIGKISDDAYNSLIMSKSIPATATKVRQISDSDVPGDREFRDAWCDATNDSNIDIDLSKTKDIALTRLRSVRDDALKNQDTLQLIALSEGSSLTTINLNKQKLRDATNDLKSLNVSGYNDEKVIAQIRTLAVLPELE